MRSGSLLLVLALLITCGGEPADTLSRVKQEGVLRVGTDATYPPFETIDPDGREVVGFDADLIREIARRLGAHVEFQVVPFDGILAALRAGKYDVVISALTITEDRARGVLFSRPYHAAGQSVCSRSGSPVRGPQDLEGRRIGVQLGTTGEMAAKRIAGARVVSFDAIGAALIDLRNGRLDAVIADTPTAMLFARKHAEIELVGDPITEESYGLAFRKDEVKLKQAVDAILEELEREGVVRKLRLRWGLERP